MSEENKTKKLFLLDAMALIYRAYYALNKNPRINSKGLNTSAILGFANTLYDLIKKENPTHIGVAFDTQAPTVRHDDYIHYKANREAMPEDLSASIPYIKSLIEAFNIPILFVDGYEADDVIGTLVKKAEEHGFETYMMTPDKDFGQLVSEKSFIYKPAKFGNSAEVWGVNEVCERFGVKRPEQVIDILGLWGDAADNIPGIPGIGEVTAKKLLEDFDNIENLLENSKDIKNPKLKEKVEKFGHQAIMSKQLATIILDVPIDFKEDDLKISDPNKEELKELLEELEFRAFANRVFTDLGLKSESKETKSKVDSTPIPSGSYQTDLFAVYENPTISEETEIEESTEKKNIYNTKHNYSLVDSAEKRKNLIQNLIKQKVVCFDTETTGLDIINSKLVGISFSYKVGEAYFVLIPEEDEIAKEIINEFVPFFANPDIEKVGQNIKFDISILKQYGIEIKGKIFDTMIAHYLIQPDMRHGMDVLAEIYLNYQTVKIESLIGKKGKDQLNMRHADTELLKEYACEDADITLQLMHVFKPLLKENDTTALFEKIEIPLIQVLSSMECEGVKIDIKALQDYSIQLETEIKELETKIFELAGTEFNIASPKQMGEILFNRLHIVEKAKLTKTKQYATGEEILSKLVNKHPIIQEILDYRSLTKLKSTYVDSLPSLVNPKTGRIHCSYNQAVAATGRLSSNNPNLQNIPIRTEKGREIRKAFVPRNEDYVLLSSDYSQVELRIIAEFSKDEDMIAAFVNNIDIHTATAAKVYGITIEEVTKDMRRNAKTVNFGIIYGISAFGLADRLNIPRKEAAQIIEQYFAKYPTIKEYMNSTIEFAKTNGFVQTIMDRKRYLRDINSNNAIVRGFAERNAINAPIQGSAADMIKIAMVDIFAEFEKQNLKSRMIMQVHDELVFDVHKTEIEIVKSIVSDKMKNAIKMLVPIEIEMNIGENWLVAH